jgi:hypothetical protein
MNLLLFGVSVGGIWGHNHPIQGLFPFQDLHPSENTANNLKKQLSEIYANNVIY